MSLIACLDPCIYQKDGICSLSRAASAGIPGPGGCVNYVPQQWPANYSSTATASRMLDTRMSSSPEGTASFP